MKWNLFSDSAFHSIVSSLWEASHIVCKPFGDKTRLRSFLYILNKVSWNMFLATKCEYIIKLAEFHNIAPCYFGTLKSCVNWTSFPIIQTTVSPSQILGVSLQRSYLWHKTCRRPEPLEISEFFNILIKAQKNAFAQLKCQAPLRPHPCSRTFDWYHVSNTIVELR